MDGDNGAVGSDGGVRSCAVSVMEIMKPLASFDILYVYCMFSYTLKVSVIFVNHISITAENKVIPDGIP